MVAMGSSDLNTKLPATSTSAPADTSCEALAELTPPSISSMIIILTLAVADSIHILMTMRTSMKAGMEKRAALIEAVRVNFLAVAITSLTTAIGFLALNFSDSPPFRHLGTMSAVGIAAAWSTGLVVSLP